MSNLGEVDDIQLLKTAQDGNAEAFGELYERYAQRVFRFLYAHLNNQQDAEDLTGEVFLRVWRALGNYKERGVPFLAFLFRIARNALIDHYRRTGKPKQFCKKSPKRMYRGSIIPTYRKRGSGQNGSGFRKERFRTEPFGIRIRISESAIFEEKILKKNECGVEHPESHQ